MLNPIYKYLNKFIDKDSKNESNLINTQQYFKFIKSEETKLQNEVTY
jgi:hypothetical protein